MKRIITIAVALLTASTVQFASAQDYIPSESNLKARQEFSRNRLGIFLHWGIYSMYGQGEWYLNSGKLKDAEYSKAAGGFYPVKFNADEWVKAFKDAGAGYITLTSRHHDGFSMFKTSTSDYNIVDGTPFGRDVVAELAKACGDNGLRFHLYYSILDWHRPDYPLGNSGKNTGRYAGMQDYDSYFNFMKTQVKELFDICPNLGCLWFDGYWDHPDGTGFDWRMKEFYEYIHGIKPDCLIGNNHHIATIAGEDIQMFEKDFPGSNTTGFAPDQKVSDVLPLEMCETMNDSWGFNINDRKYKSLDQVIVMLVRSASMNSNLLLNIGPQPDGELPEASLNLLKGLGKWMKVYAGTVNGTTGTAIPEQSWGVTTRTADKVFLHVIKPSALPSNGTVRQIVLPFTEKVQAVKMFADGSPLAFKASKDGFVTISAPAEMQGPDCVIELDIKK